MSMNPAIAAAIAAAKKQGPDMTQSVTGGGGGYTPPAAGVCLATLVGYLEIGKHKRVYNIKGGGKEEKLEDTVDLIFELAGGANKPREMEDGSKVPHRITVSLKLSLNEKANFFKLFRIMNHDDSATHFAELVGKHFLVTVVLREVGEGDSKRVYANLKDANGWTIRPPMRQEGDPLSDEGVKYVPIPAPPVLSDLRVFLWDFCDKPMWDALYIEGEYPARTNDKGEEVSPARSKNVIQDKIRKAVNWQGSPMHDILSGLEMELSTDDIPNSAGGSDALYDDDIPF